MQREIITWIDYCPNCDQRLEIHEAGAAYIIVHENTAVSYCPKCGLKLEYVDGKLSGAGE